MSASRQAARSATAALRSAGVSSCPAGTRPCASYQADRASTEVSPCWQRSYHLTPYTPMPRGGHFPAHEEPELLGGDITAFFHQLPGGPGR
jgi:hypothetical protein